MNENYLFRFSGIARLYGQKSLEKLSDSHIAIIGIGGVGSWVAEALARTGIGELTLIDLDDICRSNTNRQIHAVDGNFGEQKTEVMKDRILSINPDCKVHLIDSYFSRKNSDDILSNKYDYIVDCIDSFHDKIELIVECKKRSLPLLVCGGAGGRQDPSKMQQCDLSKSFNDKLLARVRKELRVKHGFSKNKPFKIPCVFTSERAVYPTPEGGICHKPATVQDTKLDCQTGFGTASYVTGTMAFFASSFIVKELTGSNNP